MSPAICQPSPGISLPPPPAQSVLLCSQSDLCSHVLILSTKPTTLKTGPVLLTLPPGSGTTVLGLVLPLSHASFYLRTFVQAVLFTWEEALPSSLHVCKGSRPPGLREAFPHS